MRLLVKTLEKISLFLISIDLWFPRVFGSKVLSLSEHLAYRVWLERERREFNNEKGRIEADIAAMEDKPLFSVILPVYNTDEIWLRKCIDSVIDQIYENWELCIADDRSTSPHVRTVLDEYAAADDRIKVVYREENGHISAASNSALDLATGEFCVLLDHDDELSVDALYWVAKEIGNHPEAGLIYSDEDLISKRGVRYKPKFKPDWSRDLFYSANLLTHISVFRTSVIKEIGGFTVGMEGSQDYDLSLRVIEKIGDHGIRHIPRILYHWRVIETSVASDAAAKPYAHENARKAIRSHLGRRGIDARVEETTAGLHRVTYEAPADKKEVCLVVMSGEGGVGHLIDVLPASRELPGELVIVGGDDEELRRRSGGTRVRTLALEKRPTAEALNLAVEGSSSPVIIFWDPAFQPLEEGWVEELANFAVQPDIGAVGGKLLNSNGTMLQSGLILGAGSGVGRAHFGHTRNYSGNILRSQLISNCSAVSIACMAVERKKFLECGGFDHAAFSETLFDVDLCLRLAREGYRTVFTPYAELRLRRGSNIPATLDFTSSKEMDKLREKWPAEFERDPFFNPNFSREQDTFRIII